MPLTFVKVGTEVEISRVTASDEIRKHLEHLGFLKGERVVPLGENGGNLIVRIKDTRLAINKGTAMKIMVQ